MTGKGINRLETEVMREMPPFPAPEKTLFAARLTGLDDKELAANLLSAARHGFKGAYDDPLLAEALSVYRAGILISLITGRRAPEDIAQCFGMDVEHYRLFLECTKRETVLGPVRPFEQACAAMMQQFEHLTGRTSTS